MNTEKQHVMVMSQVHQDGSEEWYCPTCGRRMVMSWPPNYKRTILNPGDEAALHSGSSGGLTLGSAAIEPVETEENTLLPHIDSLDAPADPVDLNDPYLAPWITWLDNNDLIDR